MIKLALYVSLFLFFSCTSNNSQKETEVTYPNISVVSAMKNVIWNGELEGKVLLDTISNKVGLYGVGPLSYLQGEILINNGQIYTSRVTSDTSMIVAKEKDVSAPFFVYANVLEWVKIDLPENIIKMSDLEQFIIGKSKEYNSPFAFKLEGKVLEADIHVQNLAAGSKVSSPEEAHAGQVNYSLTNEMVEIIGFFSTKHQGIFTHHDTYLHMHLITKDELRMGHLDAMTMGIMSLYLPKLN